MSRLFKVIDQAVGELSMAPVEAGAIAPDFTLSDQEGRTVRLYDLRGRPVVLIFYPRDHTPTCTGQLQQFNSQLEKLREAGGVAFGINAGDADSHRRFKADLGLDFDLLIDPRSHVARQWRAAVGPKVRRTVYAVTPGGRVAFAERGTPEPERVIRALGLWDPPPRPKDEGVPVVDLIQVEEPAKRP
ncbi:MAG: peroxiredoxin [Bradymonadia bacterium]